MSTVTDNAPLLGFLVEEDEDRITVRVDGGRWIIDRTDVVSLSDWDDAFPVAFPGRPVAVVTRSGASLGFLQTVTVDDTDRPMTLPAGMSALVGEQGLAQMAEAWGTAHAVSFDSEAVGQSPTVCDCTPVGEFGMIIKTDDCRD